jgi:hypothetical protein
VKIFAIVSIAGAVCVAVWGARLITQLVSDGLWNDPNGRKAIIGFACKGIFPVIAALHFARIAWRKKPVASAK